jgi:hypothetical protein
MNESKGEYKTEQEIPQQSIQTDKLTTSDIKGTVSHGTNLEHNKDIKHFFMGMDKLDRPIKEFWFLNYHLMNIYAVSLAIKFDLFEVLNDNKDMMSVKDIINKLNWSIDIKKIIDWLDELHVHGFLTREGCGETATYGVSDYVTKYFLKNSTNSLYYVYKCQLCLLEKFTTFEKNFPSGKADMDFTDIYKDVDMMHKMKNNQILTLKDEYQKLVKVIDCGKASTIVDGCGRAGFLASIIGKCCPDINVISMDRKEWVPLQKDFEKEIGGFPKNVKMQEGSFLDKFPEADVIILPHFLEYLKPDDVRKVEKNAFDALKKGGKIYILCNLISENRNVDDIGLMRSFFNTASGLPGKSFTFEEKKKCLAEVGFCHIDVIKEGLSLIDVVVADKC